MILNRVTLFFICCTSVLFSQNQTFTGTVTDANNNPLSFVTVLVYEGESTQPLTGASTDEEGNFTIADLEEKKYQIHFSYIGFETLIKEVTAAATSNLGTIVLQESPESLDTAVVTAKRPTISREAGKLVFNVENTSLSTGNTFDLLKKTPGVLVIDDAIQIKFQTPVIYINNKRVYLSPSEVVALLENTDASVVSSVEVITNPSAKYDGATGTVLNINTSKAISIGYKGSVNGRYEQGIYPKYNIGTSHFYKNNWLNFYGSYSFSPRKEFKEDDNFVRFFNPDGSTNAIWNTAFTRTTRSKAHQGNMIADITLGKKQTLSVSTTFSVNPNETFDNTGLATILNPQRQVDSLFSTVSMLETDTHTLSLNTEYKIVLNAEGSSLSVAGNYTNYGRVRDQDVATRYTDPEGILLQLNNFATHADQETAVFTGQADLEHSLWKGTLEAGTKYSYIDSESALDFYDTENNTRQFNIALSDDFNYLENIYAAYVTTEQQFGKYTVTAGLRGELTDVSGISRSLGEVNTQNYFDLFPRVSVQYELNEKNTLGLTYARSITRPRYESLNPFRYFINENNFDEGNPNLVPSIKDRITFNYAVNSSLFFDLYYEHIDNAIQDLIFQDNTNKTVRTMSSNLISELQYSLDITFVPRNFPKWWYFYIATSSFYLENKFFAIESDPLTYTNDTFGFYASTYSQLTLSEDRTFTSDITSLYISDLIYGSSTIRNQFQLNIAFRKSFWNKQASVTVGVDDIFNTNNIPVTSRYYNQDNSYFAQNESRLFKFGFTYNFGNARLRENNRTQTTDEVERIK